MNCPHCGSIPRIELRGLYSWECGSWWLRDADAHQSEKCKIQATQLSEFKLFQASIRAIDED